ncbi:MAG: 3-phosphoshikimate 1-carboxyvinyltransferase [Treponema sp.]|nr:3-phosphoshikimate 1-carboxyvinyltransferase [Treponema sp.]
MIIRVTPHKFSGIIKVPPSKSHTIRQLFIAALADGESEIINPLDSLDTRSCLSVCKAFGAEVEELSQEGIDDLGQADKRLIRNISGNNGFKNKKLTCAQINTGNSGTTLFFALAIAGLQSEWVEFTGDEQTQKRGADPLLNALKGLGIQSESNNGCVPIKIKGPWKGGKVSLPCPTSQYLSAILIAAPLAPSGTITEIDVPFFNEKPYIDMTLSYVNKYLKPNLSTGHQYIVPGGSRIETRAMRHFFHFVPGDFSSAAFPAAAAAISGGQVTLLGLDPKDTQGDKYFFNILEEMGCTVNWNKAKDNRNDWTVTISREGALKGGVFDLNETPDLLPAAAAVAAFAEGDTIFCNVSHARTKETDRIAVMAAELAKLGVKCAETPDGLIVHGKGNLLSFENHDGGFPVINGHGDHRIVMAFAAAALGCPAPIAITDAECTDVTYPCFFSLFDEAFIKLTDF